MKHLRFVGYAALFASLLLNGPLSAIGATTTLGAQDGFLWAPGRGTVVKVDPSTGAVLDTISGVLGAEASSYAGFAIDPEYVWVTGGWGNNSGQLSKVNKLNSAVVNISLPLPYYYGTAIAVDESSVWVIGFTNPGGALLRFDRNSNNLLATIPLNNYPTGITTDENYVWVTEQGSNTVAKISKNTNQVVSRIDARVNFGRPRMPVVDANFLWVPIYDGSYNRDNWLMKIDKNTNAILNKIAMPGAALSVVVDNQYAWVAAIDPNNSMAPTNLARVDKSTDEFVGSYSVISSPPYWGFVQTGNSLYATYTDSSNTTKTAKISKSEMSVVSTFSLPTYRWYYLVGDISGFNYDQFFQPITVNLDPNPPTTTLTKTDTDGDGILDSGNVTLNATDVEGVVSSITYSLDGATNVVTTGASVSLTLTSGTHSLSFFAIDNSNNTEATQTASLTSSDNCPSAVNSDQLDTDADGVGNACDPDMDNDGIENAIDTDPLVASVDFNDGSTFGVITDAGGWNVSITDLSGPAGVRVSISGSGTTAKFLTCNNNVETQLNASGETADITCGSTTVTAVSANPDIRVREPQGGSGGKATFVKLTNGQTVTMGSYVAASPLNTSPLSVEVVDNNDAVLGSGSLNPGQTLDIEPNGPNNTILLTNQSFDPVIFTLDGAALTLTPGEQFFDRCPNSINDPEPIENRFAWTGGGSFMTKDSKTKALIESPYTLNQTKGCTCNQILEKTSGKEKGQISGGCTKETLDSFISRNNLLGLLYQLNGNLYYVITGVVAALAALGWYLLKHAKKV